MLFRKSGRLSRHHVHQCVQRRASTLYALRNVDMFRFGLARLANGSVQRRRANARRTSDIFTYKGECAPVAASRILRARFRAVKAKRCRRGP